MKIFAGQSNPKLAERICQYLGVPLGKIYLHSFPSGERYCQFQENIRGEHVFLIQSTSNPTNDNLIELLVMCDAARRASAKTITVVCPAFFYQRQERKDKPRVPISAKLVMDMIGCAITHGCFTKLGIQRLVEAFQQEIIHKLYVSNSIQFSDRWVDENEQEDFDGTVKGYGFFHVVNVDMAQTFAEAIRRIANNQSVTELFK